MFSVNEEKCIGCGLCIKDCFVRDIEMVEGKAKIKNISCFKCGHCVAVCPVNAVSNDEFPMEDVQEYEKEKFNIESENLMNFIKFRRTIRQYQEKDVENEKILKIVEAGRFTPTAGNAQDVEYIVVKKDIEKLREITMETLKKMGEYILETSEDKTYKRYALMWIRMYNAFKENSKNDALFFNAPAVIIVTAKNPVNGYLASANMDLMINTLGLGAVFSGFLQKAIESNKELESFLNISENHKVTACLVIGYPSVKYRRTAPRKLSQINWR